MFPLRSARLCVLFLLTAGTAAQNTWTVGPTGAQFANLPPAVTAAQDGDLILVQPGGYNVGAGTFLDVLTSQSSLVSARQGLIQARLAYRNARAQIEAAIGRDLP